MLPFSRLIACLVLLLGISGISNAASLASDCLRSEIFWKLGNSEPSSSDVLIYLPNQSKKATELKTALFAQDGRFLSHEVNGKDIELRHAPPIAALVDRFVHTPKGHDLLSGYHPSFHLGPSRARFSVRDVSIQASGNHAEVSAIIDLLEIQNSSSRMDLISKGVGGVTLPSINAKTASPLTLRVPVSIDMTPDGKAAFKLLDLPGIDSSKVIFEMDGAKIPTEKVFELLKETGVIGKVRTQLLDFLNTQIAETFARETKHTISVDHPLSRSELIKFEVSPQNLTADSNALTAGIRVKIDAKERAALKSAERPVVFHCPVGGSGTCPKYDGAIAVSRPLIENVTRHLFESGAMKGLKAGERTVSVVEPPTIQYLSPASIQAMGNFDHAAAYMKIRFRVRPDKLSGLEKMALNENFSVRTEVSLKIAPSADGKSLAVQILNAKADSLAINEAGLRSPVRVLAKLASFAPSAVSDVMQKVVSEAVNTKLQSAASLPPVELPLPKEYRELLGSVKIVGALFDENGNLYFLFK